MFKATLSELSLSELETDAAEGNDFQDLMLNEFICVECQTVFPDADTLSRHLQEQHEEAGFYCNVQNCQESFSTVEELQQHMEGHSAGRLKCPHCTKSFAVTDQQTFQTHVDKHSIPKEVPCPKCGKKFLTVGECNAHAKRCQIEPEDKPWVCTICGKKFLSKDNLKQHMLGPHKLGSVHKCLDCEKSYNDRSSLWKHCNKKNHTYKNE